MVLIRNASDYSILCIELASQKHGLSDAGEDTIYLFLVLGLEYVQEWNRFFSYGHVEFDNCKQ
jgi:hypothetical protein